MAKEAQAAAKAVQAPVQISLNVKDITLDSNGNIILLAQSSKYNEKGAFRFQGGRSQRLLAQIGVQNVFQAKAFLRFGGSKLKATAQFVEAGQEWESPTGEKGVYTKSHWRIQDEVLELSPVAAQLIATEAAKSLFTATSTPVQEQAAPQFSVASATSEAIFDEE